MDFPKELLVLFDSETCVYLSGENIGAFSEPVLDNAAGGAMARYSLVGVGKINTSPTVDWSAEAPTESKPKRGRPKGSKNNPKDEAA